jgi:hypothetical protein
VRLHAHTGGESEGQSQAENEDIKVKNKAVGYSKQVDGVEV